MLNVATLIAVAFWLSVSSSGYALPPSDRTLVGTWRCHSVDAIVDTTFRTDHTFTESFNGGEPRPAGRWSLKGSKLIWDIDAYSYPPGRVVRPQTYKQNIVQLTRERLIVSNPSVTYERVK
jgi:hypothetical protein